MKRDILFVRCAVCLAAGWFCANAGAQSSVRVYGAIDLGIERADNGTMQSMRLSSGLNTVSRVGFMGTEDLGGGLKARFRLEGLVNADDGSMISRFFSRFSFVGLEGGWGAIDAGRMYSPTFVVGIASDPFVRNRSSLVQNMFLAQSSATANAVIPGFLDNSIRYTSPVWNHLWAEAMYTLGEASNASGRGVALSLQYLKGPLYLGYGYQGLYSGSAAAPAANPLQTRTHVLGARYDFGSFAIYGHLNRNFTQAAPASTNSAISMTWNISGPHTLLAQVGHRSVAVSNANATGMLLGYNYALSRRSTVYARYGRVSNGNLSSVSLNGFGLASPGADPSTMSIGVSHVF